MIWHGIDWTVYNGAGLLHQVFAADNVRVNRRGRLVVRVDDRAGGGVAMTDQGRTRGTWRVRFRMSAGVGSKYVILLWPDDGPRPEIDFAEGRIMDPARSYTSATVHRTWRDGITTIDSPHMDFTRWHTAAVRYGRHAFRFYLDGVRWARVAFATRARLHLAIQATRITPGPRARLQVDHVRVPR